MPENTMHIESGPGGTIVTNPDRRLFALLALKGRLNIEINTGLKHSRGSTIAAARVWGYTGPNRKQKCLDWTIAELDRREQQLFRKSAYVLQVHTWFGWETITDDNENPVTYPDEASATRDLESHLVGMREAVRRGFLTDHEPGDWRVSEVQI
tara:strand:- start:711 stop:1169 length:459 start_codon:yes stop_codon:yes gene_type:complete